MRKIVHVSLAVAAIGLASVGTLSCGLGDSVHGMTHKIGLCSSSHCSISAVAAGGTFKGCALDGNVEEVDLASFSEGELKVIRFVADRIIAEGKIPSFSGEEIEEATGVSLSELTEMSQARLQGGVLAELSRRQFNLNSLAGTGNCARFSACSIDRNLSGATGAELARYEEEKGQDGRSFVDWAAPDFTLPSTAGDTVSLADLRGRNVVLVFLAGHCNHCLESLTLLAELDGKYRSEGLSVVPVYINSGPAEDIWPWLSTLNLDLPFLVAERKDLAEAYDFRMVPTAFLIDRDGQVTRKLVGQKSKDELDAAFSELIATRG